MFLFSECFFDTAMKSPWKLRLSQMKTRYGDAAERLCVCSEVSIPPYLPPSHQSRLEFQLIDQKVGFQEAVTFLSGLEAPVPQTQSRTPTSRRESVESPSSNPPFKGSYEKFAVESAWLKERGLTPETLKHFEVFEYNNPKRRSAYSGSVVLTIRRYSDGECVGYRDPPRKTTTAKLSRSDPCHVP
jgi:hypothetical protein